MNPQTPPHSSLQLARACIILHLEDHRALPPLSIEAAEQSTGQGGARFVFSPCDQLLKLSLQGGPGPDFSSSAVDKHSFCQRVAFAAERLLLLACVAVPVNGAWPWWDSSLADPPC